jgi:hypothetical protein
MPRGAHQRTEHAARIAPPGDFREGSFRRKRIASGVYLVIGKRPGARSTETQSIRFDASEFTPTQAREWLARYGYTPIAFEAANPRTGRIEPSMSRDELLGRLSEIEREIPTLKRIVYEAREEAIRLHSREPDNWDGWWKAKTELGEAAGKLEARQIERDRIRALLGQNPDESAARLNDPEAIGYSHALRAVRVALDQLERARGWILNMPRGVPERMSAATVGLSAAGRELESVARAISRQIEETARENPPTNPIPPNPDVGSARLNVTEARAHLREALAALDKPDAGELAPMPNPRGLVQLGLARQLDIEIAEGDGALRRYRWTLADDWRTLTPAGAEELPAGSGRLFLVPPPSSSGTTEPPADSAGVDTFVTWHSFEPREAFAADVPTVAEFGTRLGTARSIVYRSDKWQPGEPLDYEHEFKPSEPPEVRIVGTAEAPRAVLVRGGAFRVTSRGLVD